MNNHIIEKLIPFIEIRVRELRWDLPANQPFRLMAQHGLVTGIQNAKGDVKKIKAVIANIYDCEVSEIDDFLAGKRREIKRKPLIKEGSVDIGTNSEVKGNFDKNVKERTALEEIDTYGLGAFLIDYRNRKGFTQEDLAKKNRIF